MSDVSVIGTGVMGSALVEALAASGAEVAVWNRTTDKAETLSGPRVRIAQSVAEALTVSPLAVVSVSDHELARTLVEGAGPDLQGKAVASTSFATPEQSRAFAAIVSAAGGGYLDLSILAYPSEVRSGAGVFFISGDRTAYEAHRERLEQIGRASYVDEAPGAAYISEMAVLLAYLPMAVGLLQGLRICEQHDLPMEWFKKTVVELYPFHIRSLLDRVPPEADSSVSSVEASVEVWGEGAAEYAAYLRELGLDAGMYDALHRLFAAASEAGDGDADWTCIAGHTATR
ncbi:NAD(P)-dependent oxidoreductase [Egibacter rhizosphaerae]|nr:NAD(P)-binding domain-containing protein [Egibacter rhizosphaerae]